MKFWVTERTYDDIFQHFPPDALKTFYLLKKNGTQIHTLLAKVI